MAHLSRRHFLGGLAGSAAAAILAACGGSEIATTAATAATGAATNPSGAATTVAGAATRVAPTTAAVSSSAATTVSGAATTVTGAATTAAPTVNSVATSAAPAVSSAATTVTGTVSAVAPAVVASTGKMTYWGGLIFSDDANALQVQMIKDWGKQNKIDIDVVMINQNETNMKVAAAIESNTLPDAFDLGIDLLLLQSSKLVPLDDLYKKIGTAGGGWLKSVDVATDPQKFGGTRNAIPCGTSGNVLFRRTDVLKKAGIDAAPKTWEEVGAAAEKTTKSPLYGMGFALSNVGDGNTQVQVLQSWGGRIADDAGKVVTLKSPETKAYLQWVTDLYKKGLFPPGCTTWDGAGDNNAYQSGQAVFIANTGSVSVWMRANDKDLLANTAYSALPRGPKMQVSPGTPVFRTVAKTSKNQDAAKALIEYLATPAYTSKYYPLAIYGPVLQNETTQDIFKSDPVHQGLADLAVNGTAPGFPDTNNTAYADFNNNFIVPKMIQRVVIDKYDLDKAIDEAQKAGEAIYAKYK